MPSSSPVPSVTLTLDHLYYCFDVISAHLGNTNNIQPSPAVPDGDLSFPLFVTWEIYSNASGKGTPRLRGCIGTFEALPLQEGLEEYSIISAFKDRRFKPISKAELEHLEVTVSLLTGFEECSDYLDWDIGTHGIYIDFPSPNDAGITRRFMSSSRTTLTATYLPDVAKSQRWTKVETIDSAIRKAGYHGTITEDFRKSIHVRRYQSEKLSARYADWKSAREVSGK